MATELTVRAVELAYRQPLRTGHGVYSRRSLAVVRLDDGQHIGWGEAAPLAGWTPDPVADIIAAIKDAGPEVCQFADCGDTGLAAVNQLLDKLNLPATARFGLEGAIVNLIASRQQLPAAQVLNPAAGCSMPVNGLAAVSAAAELDAAVHQSIDPGFTVIKVKITADVITRISDAIKTARGVAFRLDCNNSLSPQQLLSLAGELDAVRDRIEYVEDPVDWRSRELVDQFRARSGCRLAWDQSAADRHSISQLMQEFPDDTIIVKPSRLGGYGPVRDIVRQIRSTGGNCVLTSMIEGPIGLRHCFDISCALGDEQGVPGLGTGKLLAHDGSDGLSLARGTLTVVGRPCPPGSGVLS